MKKALLFFGIFFSVLSLSSQSIKQGQGFIENNGQVSDQYRKSRPDVLFSGSHQNFVYHLRNTGISYQLNSVDAWRKEIDEHQIDFKGHKKENMVPDQTTVYRLDLEWLNMNPHTKIQTDDALPGFSNYYLDVCPDGIQQVKTYKGITYKNIYSNIDLHYYHSDGQLKYDYLVAAQADYKQIQIQVKGSTGISIQHDGTLVLKTPLGDVIEAAPLVFQNKKQLKAKWVRHGNVLSFSINNVDPELPLVIDPLVRLWGTFYGDNNIDEGKGCATDANGFVFLTGRTKSTLAMATSGAFQASLSGTDYDAFLVKFNDLGVRQWATYYGGTGEELGLACATDALGNAYVVGKTTGSSSGIASGGTAHQGFNGGGADAFFVKFSSTGARVWGTYYGGPNLDQALAVAVSGNDVYISGMTASAPGGFPANPIATTGGHQTAVGNGFLVKFNTSGVRQWGTYYGGTTYAPANAVAVDASGNVYIAGMTLETTDIATPGSHQPVFNSFYDGYLAKFNAAGVRQWGTYYGDVSLDTFNSCATDASGNVYVGGQTGSPTNIATAGAHQTVIGMAFNGDGMLIKFNAAGVRQWGTYYGGNTDDGVSACAVSPAGDVYIAGISNSPAGIATFDGFQPNLVFTDAFLARFTQAGVRVWGTYYGDAAVDIATACAAGANGKIYIAGYCGTATNIATQGSHQSTYGGNSSDAFLAQFYDCAAPANPVSVTAPGNSVFCSGNSATLSATATGTVNWFNSPTSLSPLSTGTLFVTAPLTAGTYTFYAETTNTCSLNSARIPIMVTVNPPAAINVTSNKVGVCPGESGSLTATGAFQYTWSVGGNSSVVTITPALTTTYSVNGVSAQGCLGSATIVMLVFSIPTVSITAPSAFCMGAVASLTATGANQYSWTTGASAAVTSITPQSSTSFTVTGTSIEGCKATASIAVQVTNCTGIEKFANTQFRVFPNPINDELSIRFVSDELLIGVEITITNALGQLMQAEILHSEKMNLDLGNYPIGIYFLSLKNGTRTEVFKLVKK